MSETKRAQRIRAALEALQDKHGRLTAHIVIKAAKSPKHPLHSEFPWDVKKAAYERWVDIANGLIRYVTVVTIERNEKVVAPFYVRDPMKKPSEPGMIAINSDIIERQSAEKIMLAELARCEDAIRRARAVVGQLSKKHRGLSARLERMLSDLVETQELLAA